MEEKRDSPLNGQDLVSFGLFFDEITAHTVHFCLLNYTMKVYKSNSSDLHSDRYTKKHNGAQCRLTSVKKKNAPAR